MMYVFWYQMCHMCQVHFFLIVSVVEDVPCPRMPIGISFHSFPFMIFDPFLHISAEESQKGKNNIRDELDELIVLSDVNYLFFFLTFPFNLILLFLHTSQHTSSQHTSSQRTSSSYTLSHHTSSHHTSSHQVRLLVGEWIPFGANNIVLLNTKLGATERVKVLTSRSFCDG